MMRRFVILPVLALGLMFAAPPAQASVSDLANPQFLDAGVGAGKQRQSKGEKKPKPRKPGPQDESDGD